MAIDIVFIFIYNMTVYEILWRYNNAIFQYKLQPI